MVPFLGGVVCGAFFAPRDQAVLRIVIWLLGLMMRRFQYALLAAVAAFGFVSGASAADMPVKAPVAAAAYNWTGFYVGGNVGYGWANNSVAVTGDGNLGAGNDIVSRVFDGVVNFNDITRFQDIRAKGAVGGLQFGYNWQVARTWVAGLEADIQGSGVKGSETTVSPAGPATFITSEQKLRWFGTLRARLGLLATDRVLVFATGGLAFGQTNVNSAINSAFSAAGSTSIGCTTGAVCLAGSSSKTSAGWTAGGGVEWAVMDRWTAKAEYLHIALADQSIVLVTQAPGNGNGTVNAQFKNRFDIVRLGVNYRF
jgi:outer membrane immunogenic protein